ncbi:MAG: riboflavin synthase [Syntrophomonadaceae bacterium]|nr:riboflavin synthase [Syntrophomonadaceae bacterium]
MVIVIFTGIIEELGTIKNLNKGSNSFLLEVKATLVLDGVKLGDSIAVNGVCLTVTHYNKDCFTADVMPETVARTTLHQLKKGMPVNLERAVRLGDRMGGHLVQGHVDGVGSILQKEKLDIAIIYRIKAPAGIIKYTVPKGSIAIDGISLTVIDVFPESFSVSLIPHTAHLTTLGTKNPGDLVNLESDIIGRYVEKLLNIDDNKSNEINMGYLAQHGFI